MTAAPHADANADGFGFAVSTRVEIADTDLGGVVYYGNYARLLDRALMAYRRELGIPELGPAGHLFVVRHLACDYRRSARFGDELTVRIRTARVGRSSQRSPTASKMRSRATSWRPPSR